MAHMYRALTHYPWQLGDELVKKKKQQTSLHLYQAANYKIKRVLRDRKPAKPSVSLKSDLMETMFEIERREMQGATIIQKFWHKFLIIKLLKENVNKGKRIVIIQACVRGMISRKWLSLWYKNRFLMIIQWQARFRKFLSNKKIRMTFAEEVAAAVKTQKAVRMFLAKCVAYWKRLHLAAERVQVRIAARRRAARRRAGRRRSLRPYTQDSEKVRRFALRPTPSFIHSLALPSHSTLHSSPLPL